MATVQLGRDARLYLAQYDLTTNIQSVALAYGADALDATTLSSTTRTRAGGLKSVSLGYSGFWDATASSSGIDKVMNANLGVSGVPATVTPTKSSEGAIAYLFTSLHTEYQHGGAVGELKKISVKAEGDANLVRGQIMRNTTAESSGKTGTWFQLGGSTTKTAVNAALHIFSAPGTSSGQTLTISLQSANSSLGGGATSRIAFTASSAEGGQWGTPFTAGTTQDWWAAVAAVAATSEAGSYSYIVSAGLSTN